jgi:putative endonuclease
MLFKLLGARGERIAAKVLRRAGYRIVARNYSCAAGEIDLIARDGDTLVFVEVKTRSTDAKAFPEVNVHRAKQRQIARVAKMFVLIHKMHDTPCRFDVVSVVCPAKGKPSVEHFVDAFPPA